VVEHDDAVRDVLLDARARQLAVPALAGDHRGHAAVLQPAEQAPQLSAQHPGVLQRSEQGLDRVDDHALGTDLVDRGPKAQEQPVEVPVAGLLDLRPHNADVVDHELTAGLELGEVEAQRSDVRDEILPGLLERHEHPRFAELYDPANEELRREQGLPAPGGTADQSGPAAREAATGHLVEAVDPGWRLRE
jgi:hypothetical protein